MYKKYEGNFCVQKFPSRSPQKTYKKWIGCIRYNDILSIFVFPCQLLFSSEQLIQRHAKQIGDGNEEGQVGITYLPLPLGNRLHADTQGIRQLPLCYVVQFP